MQILSLIGIMAEFILIGQGSALTARHPMKSFIELLVVHLELEFTWLYSQRKKLIG